MMRPFCMWMPVTIVLMCAAPASAQVSPEEHAKHHPEQQATTQPTGAQPPSGVGMGEMMESMHGGTPPKQLYPTLMELPELSAEARDEVQRAAHERMQSGTALMAQGLDQLVRAAPTDDFAAMQQAIALLREGTARFDSGLAAHRALSENQDPRAIAMTWFKSQMNLQPPAGAEPHRGVLRVSWFHLFVMAVLIGFAITMIWMYFHKMQRASRLLQELTGGVASTSAPAASASASLAQPSSGTLSGPEARAAPTSTKPTKWSGKLRVGRIFQETPNVKTFRLMNPLGGVMPFAFLPGQFITVTVTSDGKPVRRSYTIASSPTQHDYIEATVKHEEGGVVSGFLHDQVHQGDLLEFTGPIGSFIFTGRECTCILLIGGGVGITPLMSVLRYLTDRSWQGDIFLIYGCRTPSDIIFREELDYLQRRHANLRIVITISHPEGADWKGPTGFITKELIGQSVPDIDKRYVHICGPVPMMEAAKKILAELGVPKDRVKTEAFGPALGKPEPPLTAPPSAAPPVGAVERAARLALPTVTFALSDKSAPLPPDKPVLDVAEEIGVEIDNSCRVGECGLCRIKLLSGDVTMAVTKGLEPGDKANNIILACQAKSTNNVKVEA